MKYLPVALLLLVTASPLAASAATLRPVCAITATSPSGQHWLTFGNSSLYVLADANVPFTVIWGSANATQASDGKGQPISVTGQQDVSVTKTATLSYTFSNGDSQAVCDVTAVVLTNGVSASLPTNTPPATSVPVGSGPSSSLFSASMIPLLSGGNATPGSAVPVAYLKLVNLSATNTATLPGVWLKQNGNAPVSKVIGFTTVDDKAVSRTSVGGTEGSMLFNNTNEAYVPLNASFAPGQFRIFTIKAQMSSNLSGALGTSLMLDVLRLDTSGAVAGTLPIHGVTWTLHT